jgi:phage terminase large subunit-like protein
MWSTSCLDWEERIVEGRSLIPPPLFPDERAMTWFRDLWIADVGCTIGDAAAPWALDFASSIFGALDQAEAKMLIREFFLLISKKNSKSTLGAGIMLTALLRNGRPSAEFLIVAPTVEIANNSYQPAREMVRNDERLTKLLLVRDHLKIIEHRTTGSTLKVIAADSETVSGKKATGVLIDELWLFGKRANAENMLREATGGLVSRPEGFVIYLSTQSDEPPAGVFKSKLDYFRDVRDGKIVDKRSLPVIFEFPKHMIENRAYLDPANFYVSNPNIGRSVDAKYLEDELIKAQHTGAESVQVFVAKHMNVETGLSLRSSRWAGADKWADAADASLTLASVIDRSEALVIGVDIGGRDDLFSLAVLGRVTDDQGRRHWFAWSTSWCYPAALQQRQSEASRFHDFERAGELKIVSASSEVYDDLVKIVEAAMESGKLCGIGVDKEKPGDLADVLTAAGIDVDEHVRGVSQGWRLTGAIEALERSIEDDLFKHCGSSLLNWSVGNARVEVRGNARLITKALAGTGKIDPLISVLTACSLMLTNPEPQGSIYNQRGLVFFG